MASIRYSTAGSMRIYDNYLNNTVAKQNHKKISEYRWLVSATLRLAQWEPMVISSTLAKQNHKKSRNIDYYISATLRLAQWESMVITSTKH
jgi:hypothetical protein